MAKKKSKAKKAAGTILGMTVGTILLGTGLIATGYMLYKERGKREDLEKQVTGLGATPVTQAPANGNGAMAAGSWG